MLDSIRGCNRPDLNSEKEKGSDRGYGRVAKSLEGLFRTLEDQKIMIWDWAVPTWGIRYVEVMAREKQSWEDIYTRDDARFQIKRWQQPESRYLWEMGPIPLLGRVEASSIKSTSVMHPRVRPATHCK